MADLFKEHGIEPKGGMSASPSRAPQPRDLFKEHAAEAQPRDEMPWWYPMASGALGGRLTDLMPKVVGLGAELGSRVRGEELPPGFSYDQAKQRAEMAARAQEREQPTWTGVGETIGMLPGMLAGGELINMGLKGLGPTGRFLAGSPDVPMVSRTATGQFAKIHGIDKLYAEGVKALSRGAMGAREGAQAATLGALSAGNDVGEAAKEGAVMGGAIGTAAAPVMAGLGKVSHLPRVVANALPAWAKAGGLGGGSYAALENAGPILNMLMSNPMMAAGVAGTAGTLAGANYLTAHPAIRDLLVRLATMGVGGASGAVPSPSPARR